MKKYDSNSINLVFKESVVNTLLESMSEGVVIIDNSGKIIFVNKRFTEIFGYRKNEILNKNLDALLPHSHKDSHANRITEYFKNPVIRPMGNEINIVGKQKQGRIIPLEISLTYMELDEGTFGLAFITDITKRKKAQDELKTRNEELDSFAHMVAHDLNSTVNNIAGFSNLLLSDIEIEEDERSTILQRIVNSSLKMSSIVREMLLFANIKREEIELKPLDMKSIIESVLDRLQLQIKEKNVKIKIAKSLASAKGYAPWIEEVWFNLISNAIKYGGKPPEISIGSLEKKRKNIFWISDNGLGLKDEDKKLILKNPEKVKHPEIQGHGYGISIVIKILKKLNGKLYVESEMNNGTTFSFTLNKSENKKSG